MKCWQSQSVEWIHDGLVTTVWCVFICVQKWMMALTEIGDGDESIRPRARVCVLSVYLSVLTPLVGWLVRRGAVVVNERLGNRFRNRRRRRRMGPLE